MHCSLGEFVHVILSCAFNLCHFILTLGYHSVYWSSVGHECLHLLSLFLWSWRHNLPLWNRGLQSHLHLLSWHPWLWSFRFYWHTWSFRLSYKWLLEPLHISLVYRLFHTRHQFACELLHVLLKHILHLLSFLHDLPGVSYLIGLSLSDLFWCHLHPWWKHSWHWSSHWSSHHSTQISSKMSLRKVSSLSWLLCLSNWLGWGSLKPWWKLSWVRDGIC